MASIGAIAAVQTIGTQGAALAGGGFATQAGSLTFGSSVLGGLGGLALIAAAGFLDQRFIMPAILGKQKNAARPKELLGIPEGGQTAGDPRVWAIGRRVRVLAPPMFQSTKVRESNPGGGKAGMNTGTIRRTFADLGITLNDRLTQKVTQIIANGKLIWWSDRNLNTIRTSHMTASAVSGRLRLTMATVDDPDFADHFAVPDRILLAGWLANGGPSINGYWKVNAVTHHSTTPSTIDLDIYGGQSLTSLAATAGSDQTPASVAKVDDAFVEDVFTSAIASVNTLNIVFVDEAQHDRFTRVFGVGDFVKLTGWSSGNGIKLKVLGYDATQVGLFDSLATLTPGAVTPGTSTNAGVISFFDAVTGGNFVPGLFAANPALHFHQGTEDQLEDDIIARTETTNTIPGFRGVAYQVFDQFDYSTYFGNSAPLCEAIQEPDPFMTWRDAIAAVCLRSGLSISQIDVSAVTGQPFEGLYLLGPMSGVQAMQPILMAGQIVTQERDGVIAFFPITAADVVQIENGATFSDLSTRSGGGTPNSGDKLKRGRVNTALLPTRVEVIFQDVDHVYAKGSAPFGMRNPTPNDHDKEEEVDLSMMAMTGKAAKNLAATLLRRTWINSDTIEMELPVAYMEVIENDLLTVTDDDGNDVLCRVVRRDMGANFVVAITAVREHLNLAVHGSPAQRIQAPPPILQAATPVIAVLDIPPLFDGDRFVPSVYLAACAPRGGHWAGASVYESRDGGTSYHLAATIAAQSGVGVTTTDLDSTGDLGELPDGTVTWDTVTTFDIQLENDGPFPIATVTEADVLAGLNWFYVSAGGEDFEILGARDITDNGNGSYTLSHLLRGLRGTFHSCTATKVAGAAVVVLFDAPTVLLDLQTTDVPVTRRYKFLGAGQSLGDVDHVELALEGWNARPMVVRDFDATNEALDEIRFTLRHWSRINNPVGSKGPFALDEAFEGYRIRIYDGTGATLLRVKHRDAQRTGSPNLLNPTFSYTQSEQIADSYTPASGDPFYVEIEQLGDFGINTDSGTVERRGGRTFRQVITP